MAGSHEVAISTTPPVGGIRRPVDGYLGYVLRLDGELAGEHRPFTIGIGKAAHAKHEFQVGFEVSGEALPVPVPRTEPAELYKASKLKVLASKPCSRVNACAT